MPEESIKGRSAFLSKKNLLSDDELLRLVSAFTQLGVNKIRLTGGEPLLRPLLRENSDTTELLQSIRALWSARSDRYSEIRHLAKPADRPEMYRMGG
jgi:cyclic pyranopterin phosphate synthase